MEDQPITCGQGLAHHAVLPAQLADLVDAMAEVLDAHLLALDLRDEDAQREHDVYRELAKEHRAAALELRAIAARMAGSRDLPMGRHDEAALSGPEQADAFATLVSREQDLRALLQQLLEEHRRMLLDVS